MSIAGVDEHQMFDKFPCRLPVWWGYYGEIGIQPDIKGISGKKVILRIQKSSIGLRRFWQIIPHVRSDALSMLKIACYGSL